MFRRAIEAMPLPVRDLALLTALLCALIAGTYTIVRVTTDYLLYRDASSDASNWAEYLGDNVADIAAIASGEVPSSASIAFLESTRKSRDVYRFKIFNPEGYSQLVSEPDKIALVDLSEFSEQAAYAAATHQHVLKFAEGRPPDAAYYSLAFVPIIRNGTTVAVVAAYLDRGPQRAMVQSVFLKSAIALCLMSAL